MSTNTNNTNTPANNVGTSSGVGQSSVPTTQVNTAASSVPAAATAQTTTPAAANQQAGNYASASLYVGDLAPDVTEALLFEIFNAVGPVASVRVCRDAATRRSLGYAYVNFHRVDDAERALDTMNFKNIRNRPCRIMWSHRDPSLRKSGLGNIFVNHLAKSIDNKQLYDTFSMFGNILSCKVAMNSKRESLGYGFVHYESEESAQNAIARVDGKVIAGEKVSVGIFKSKKERGVNKNKFTNVFCKNLPPEATQESVVDLFRKYGTITSSVVQVDKEQKNRAFAFINFETAEQAQAAVDALNNQEMDGRKLYVSRAQKREEREKELRDRFEQLKQERAKKYAGVNLYVKNLADDMDDKKLTEEFSKFGTITNAAIMVDPNTKKSRGFGFVCFSTPEEATKAVTEMNGRMIDGKPLYVALAQRKEARRAQLEAQYAARAKIGGPQQTYNPAAAAMMYPQAGRGGYGAMNPMMQAYNQQQMAALAAVQGRGWNPNQPNPMMAAAAIGRMPGAPGVNYQLLPVNARVGGINPMMNPNQGSSQQRVPGPRNQNPNARRGPNTQTNVPMQGTVNQGALGKPNPQQAAMQQQAVRYADNVRNRSNQSLQGPNTGMTGVVGTEQVVMPAPNEPLTIKALAAAPEEIRKQMIGERLFPLIKLQEPLLAGKITGMLLEMDNGELIHLLESQAALNEKIQEALQVLHAHPQEVQQAQQQETEA